MQFLKILLVMGVIGVVCCIAGLMLDWFFSFRVRFWGLGRPLPAGDFRHVRFLG